MKISRFNFGKTMPSSNALLFLFSGTFFPYLLPILFSQESSVSNYIWTTDHMHVGVRWQPFGFPKCEEYDANRPVLKEHSSYAQFWVSWNAAEPNPKNTDYSTNMSGYLKAIDHAVNLC
ncbi:MAG TPA: hypothetical protein DCW45_03555, partial [Opitutae bacterium]|nr:hypothetical protein [Opitutae bacterium]